MSTHTYPDIGGVYRWNATQRITAAVGREPRSTHSSSGFFVVHYEPDLDVAETAALDALMASDGATLADPAPNVGNSIFVVEDIQLRISQIEADTGIPVKAVYYLDSGSGEIDEIQIHFFSELSNPDKNKIEAGYNGLTSWIVG